jgi:hypothetical protein
MQDAAEISNRDQVVPHQALLLQLGETVFSFRDGWFHVPLGDRRYWLPARCCWCMTQTANRWPIGHRGTPTLELPICQRCQHQWRIRRLRFAIAWLAPICVMTLVVATALYFGTGSRRREWFVVPLPIIGFVALFAWAAANSFLLPIRPSPTFAGPMRFRFRNREYHELVMSMVREQAPDRAFSAETLRWQP